MCCWLPLAGFANPLVEVAVIRLRARRHGRGHPGEPARDGLNHRAASADWLAHELLAHGDSFLR